MKLYSKNPRQITEKEYKDLEKWLRQLGDLGGIVHDLNSDEIIGGNQRSRVFDINQCQVELLQTFEQPDEQGTVGLGFVIWEGKRYSYRQVRWNEKQCEQANIIANKAGGDWDFDVLANNFELDDLLEWGFDKKELDLDLWLPEPPEDPGAQMDKAEELRERWGVESGQLWQLGDHRLICGDCTDRTVVERVMGGEKATLCLTDPPYATGGISSDYDISVDELIKLIDDFLPIVRDYSDCILLTPGNSFQFYYPRPTWVLAWFVDAGTGINPWGFTFWNAVFAYGNDPYLKNGLGSRPDAFVKSEASDKVDHPTSKPIGVWSWILERGSIKRGDIILDPFLGSGTTLIACERLGRHCRAVEISPAYCAVAIQRWVDMTGKEPELLEEIRG